ncbi:MAG: phosphohistidine phosphatase [Sphingobacteriales bacterium UTBCD1]|nr:MAG: phosphohistidine phosphatase [Sphingobacteriales bacterium UTBCD1]
MKILILIRHAKSSQGDGTINDFERPLNERGKNDAPVMARRLIARGIKVDMLISSPAKRAAKTAKLFAKELEIENEKIVFKTELYLASVDIFYDVIEKANNNAGCIAVFSHNPSVTDFANDLTEVHVDNIPTCGIFAIKADTGNWADFGMAKKKFLFFDYPGN